MLHIALGVKWFTDLSKLKNKIKIKLFIWSKTEKIISYDTKLMWAGINGNILLYSCHVLLKYQPPICQNFKWHPSILTNHCERGHNF